MVVTEYIGVFRCESRGKKRRMLCSKIKKKGKKLKTILRKMHEYHIVRSMTRERNYKAERERHVTRENRIGFIRNCYLCVTPVVSGSPEKDENENNTKIINNQLCWNSKFFLLRSFIIRRTYRVEKEKVVYTWLIAHKANPHVGVTSRRLYTNTYSTA